MTTLRLAVHHRRISDEECSSVKLFVQWVKCEKRMGRRAHQTTLFSLRKEWVAGLTRLPCSHSGKNGSQGSPDYPVLTQERMFRRAHQTALFSLHFPISILIRVVSVIANCNYILFIRQMIYSALVHPNYTCLFADHLHLGQRVRPPLRWYASFTSSQTCIKQNRMCMWLLWISILSAAHTSVQILKSAISDCSYNWLLDYFSSCHHCTRVKTILSELLEINASINKLIQGSGIGPVSYVVNASDLWTIFLLNILFKYTDDTYLIVPASLSHTVDMELKSIADWAVALNTKKSMENII